MFLESFRLPSRDDEDAFVLSYPAKLEMRCYSDNVYPFKVFALREMPTLSFVTPITLFYGGNGSGKSTLLNIIAEKLQLVREAPFNRTPFYEDYLELCFYRLAYGNESLPKGSRIITSDDVFDYLLDIRAINEGIDRKREELFREYDALTELRDEPVLLTSLDEHESFKRMLEAKRKTKSAFVTPHLKKEYRTRSNGESAFFYFTEHIKEGALYLLDEPENSLSVTLQKELAAFIEDSARFYRCQFVISTHSPFLLSMKGARVYDLDAVPVEEKNWTCLPNVRLFYDFFQEHKDEFEKK